MLDEYQSWWWLLLLCVCLSFMGHWFLSPLSTFWLLIFLLLLLFCCPSSTDGCLLPLLYPASFFLPPASFFLPPFSCLLPSAFIFCSLFRLLHLLLLVAEYFKYSDIWWMTGEDAMVGWEANWKLENEEWQKTGTQTNWPSCSWEVDFDCTGNGDVAKAPNQCNSGQDQVLRMLLHWKAFGNSLEVRSAIKRMKHGEEKIKFCVCLFSLDLQVSVLYNFTLSSLAPTSVVEPNCGNIGMPYAIIV